MAEQVKRSVIPIYLIGLVWLGYALVFSLKAPLHYVLCTGLSLLVFTMGKAVFPDKIVAGSAVPDKEAGDSKPQPKQEQSHSPEINALLKERDRALAEMRRLNETIEDERISAQIDHMEEVARKIIDQVAAQPQKLPQIRRFMDYYLPTTLKILNAYDRMDATGISGDNIDVTKKKVEGMMDTISLAFDKQLDSLFGAEAMDISTDITVMETMLAQEGIGELRF